MRIGYSFPFPESDASQGPQKGIPPLSNRGRGTDRRAITSVARYSAVSSALGTAHKSKSRYRFSPNLYRFFDATPHAEFLYDCVGRTIETDLPSEADFLKRFDGFRSAIERIAEMPESTLDLLFRCLRQNDGRLSRRAKEAEFEVLSED